MNDSDRIAKHFDIVSSDYDKWKKRNWYYYTNLKKLVKTHIPENLSVLEIGCGTGDILASVKPKTGIGIDISGKMIEIAAAKYSSAKNLSFFQLETEKLVTGIIFDHIFLVDVVEHVPDIIKLTKDIKKITSTRTKVFLSMGNPLWEPLLMILEKFGMKMPEGEHYRIPFKELLAIFKNNGFILKEHGYSLLIPGYIPFISNLVNSVFTKIPMVNKLGMIEYMEFGIEQ